MAVAMARGGGELKSGRGEEADAGTHGAKESSSSSSSSKAEGKCGTALRGGAQKTGGRQVPKKQKNMQTCASIDLYVSGLGAYNSANARHSIKCLKDHFLYATKASWQTWERLSVHSDKFRDLFWVLKMAGAAVQNFMEPYYAQPRRLHLLADSTFDWPIVPQLINHLLANRDAMQATARGQLSPQRFRLLQGALEEAGWTHLSPQQAKVVRKKDEGCYWLLMWIRGSVLRSHAQARLAVVGEARLKRYALRTAVKFVSNIMRDHTPLYYTSEKSWINIVSDDDDEEDFTSSSDDDTDDEY